LNRLNRLVEQAGVDPSVHRRASHADATSRLSAIAAGLVE
jgi:hypothetical protein